MSVISSRKSLNSSILKSASRNDSIKKTKILRFEVNLSSVKEILKDLESNPNVKSYQNLVYKLTEPELKVRNPNFIHIATYFTTQGYFHVFLFFRMKNCVRSCRKPSKVCHLYTKTTFCWCKVYSACDGLSEAPTSSSCSMNL